MTRADSRLLRVGDVLPRLKMASTDDTTVAVPGNKAALLVFVHEGGCRACWGYLEDELAGAVADLRDWATQVVAVGLRPEPGAALPFPVVADEDGVARRRLGIGDEEGAVLLTDRWGEVMEITSIGADHGFPLLRQLVESAKIVDLSCGECNVPGPEWRQAGA